MAQDESPAERPIVRLTRWEVAVTGIDGGRRGKKAPPPPPQTRTFTYYGVDAAGAERVYAQHATEEVDAAWRATDPLWQEAQRATIRQLLADPQTRDTVLKINIKAALDKGDTETAMALVRQLSPGVRQQLLGTHGADAQVTDR